MSESTNNQQITFISNPIEGKPKIDVVLQATGNHAWNMSQGWINTLHREGLLNRAFRPFGEWEAEEPSDDDGLYEYLKNPQADIMLLLGFDWHSQPLHKTVKWQERWFNSSIIKIAILNEECSSRTVQNSLQWQQKVFSALDSSIPCVDAIICNHETDVEFLRHQKFIAKPIAFQPFAIDTEYFKSNIAFQERVDKAFFRGRIVDFYNSGSYEKRKLLVKNLSQCKEVCLKDYEDDLTLEDYIKDLNQYKILINLPSISLTLTARVFEALGCGGTLLQNSVVGTTSNSLFKDWEHLVYYNSSDPDDLVAKLKYLIKNPKVAEKIAKQGYELCYKEHSIQARIEDILKWVDEKFYLDNAKSHLLLTKDLEKDNEKTITKILEREKKVYTIVIDGVFFQLHQTGIARVWRSLLEEWSKSGFASHIIVLDREKTAPRIPGFRYRNIEPYNYEKTGLDSQMLQFVCDEVGADLFISTYYTTPLSTPSIFMAYDMIPEVIGADLNNPSWREKHNGIFHAYRYLSISRSTANDLVRFFPYISPESITVAYCGIPRSFIPADSHEIASFKAKYLLRKPYFLLVGSRLGLDGYKNAILFFKALNHFPQRNEVDVVCVGGEPTLEPEFAELAENIQVHLLTLDDTELKVAYSGAITLVYPSLYEGFGMPIAEAMACGCPVITCRNSSISEVAGEAAIYVDEYQVEEMVDALSKVQIPEVRHSLIERGFEQVKQFSWTKMAETIMNVLMTTAEQLKDEKITQVTLIWQEFRNIQAQLQKLPSQTEFHPAHQKQFKDRIALLNEEIAAMKTSKFWKLRTQWFKIKDLMGFNNGS
jgi:glycosyltransferase involved in cell wall biosynthesis